MVTNAGIRGARARPPVARYVGRLAAVALACWAGSVSGGIVSWIGATGGNWETGTNWSTGSPPTAADFVDIVAPVTVSIASPGNKALEVLLDAELDVTAGELAIGGTLESFGGVAVRGGGVISTDRFFNRATAGATVTGGGSQLLVNAGLFSSGLLHIDDGAAARAASIESAAALRVTRGGSLAGDSFVNTFAGTFEVTGTDSLIEIRDAVFSAGDGGVHDNGRVVAGSIDVSGALVVDTGATVQTSSSIFTASGIVTVSDAGSRYQAGGDIFNSGELVASWNGAMTAGSFDNSGRMRAVAGGQLAAGSLINTFLGTIEAHDAGSSFDIAGSASNSGVITTTHDALTRMGSLDNSGLFEVAFGGKAHGGSMVNTFTGLISVRDPGSSFDIEMAAVSSGVVSVAHGAALSASSIDNSGDLTVTHGGNAAVQSVLNTVSGNILVADPGSVFDAGFAIESSGVVRATLGGALIAGSIDNSGQLAVDAAATAHAASVLNTSTGLLSVSGVDSSVRIDTHLENLGTVFADADAALELPTANVVNHGTVALTGGSHAAANGWENAAGASLLVADPGTFAGLGGALSNRGTIRVAHTAHIDAAAVTQDAGSFVLDHASLSAPTTDIDGGLLAGVGTVTGTTRIGPGGAISAGRFAGETAALALIGDFTLAGLGLFEIGGELFDLGLGVTEYDRLVVTGAAMLDGLLHVTLIDGFAPGLGSFFDVIVADSITLGSLELALPVLSSGLNWHTSIASVVDGLAYRLRVVRAAPEPPTAWLAALALALVILKGARERERGG